MIAHSVTQPFLDGATVQGSRQGAGLSPAMGYWHLDGQVRPPLLNGDELFQARAECRRLAGASRLRRGCAALLQPCRLFQRRINPRRMNQSEVLCRSRPAGRVPTLAYLYRLRAAHLRGARGLYIWSAPRRRISVHASRQTGRHAARSVHFRTGRGQCRGGGGVDVSGGCGLSPRS
jgi:hypothetical protein